LTGLALVLAILGAAWGFVADRIAARWPEHEADEPTAAPEDAEGATGQPTDAPAPPQAAGAGLRPAGWVRALDWRTPVVIAIGAGALGSVGLRFDDPVELIVFAVWAAMLTVMFATDLDQRLLPDVLTLPLIPIAIVLVLADLDPFVARADLPVAALTAVLVPVGLFALSLPFGAGAFGLGDVKFLIGFGLLAGAERFIVGLVSGILLAGVVIVVLLVLRRIRLRTFIPYGPFLILGALWALLGPR
jgi:leader peptidase (prepilin peptidase)/N-methyltransferase